MLNLYRAVRSNHLNQKFGFNLSWAKLNPDGTPVRPFSITTADTCPPGYAPFYQLLGMKGHDGDDWMAYHGEPVYFDVTDGNGNPIQGTCYDASDNDGGLGVDVVFQDPDTQEWFKVREWHFLNSAVANGQKIMSGDIIGHADTTGASSGDHLHEGFKPLNSANPSDNKFPGNGYNAAVDPRTLPNVHDYRDSSFILDILNLKQQLSLAQKVLSLLTQLSILLKRSKSSS